MNGLTRRYNLKKLKYKILIIIAIIIGIVFIAYFTNSNKTISKSTQTENNHNAQNSEIKTEKVSNSAMYFTVKSCIDKYTKYLSEKNTKAIYSVLSQDYINENDVNVNNVLNHIETIDGKNIDFNIEDMRVENDGKEIQIYYISGILRNEESQNKNVKLKINIDLTNRVFSITPTVTEEVFDE